MTASIFRLAFVPVLLLPAFSVAAAAGPSVVTVAQEKTAAYPGDPIFSAFPLVYESGQEIELAVGRDAPTVLFKNSETCGVAVDIQIEGAKLVPESQRLELFYQFIRSTEGVDLLRKPYVMVGIDEQRLADPAIVAILREFRQLVLAVTGAGAPLDLDRLPAVGENLYSLYVVGPISDAGMAQVARVTGLRGLSIDTTALSKSGFSSLASLTHLRSLELRSGPTTPDTLRSLTTMRELHSFTLDTSSGMPRDMSDVLAKQPELVAVKVHAEKLRKADLRSLLRLQRVLSLSVDTRNLDDNQCRGEEDAISKGAERQVSRHISCAFAYPHESPDYAVGGSFGGMFSPRRQPLLSVDLTLAPHAETLWGSTGLRTAVGKDGAILMPYVEAGFWLGLNWGIGATLAIPTAGGTPHALLHFFMGLPIPIGQHLFVEPYYRPVYGDLYDTFGWHQEVGLLVKYTKEGPNQKALRSSSFFCYSAVLSGHLAALGRSHPKKPTGGDRRNKPVFPHAASRLRTFDNTQGTKPLARG